jgi:hypothetical protein
MRGSGYRIPDIMTVGNGTIEMGDITYCGKMNAINMGTSI